MVIGIYNQSKNAKCPFYEGECSQKIICEGHLEDTNLHFTFPDKTEWKLYKDGYCNSIKGCEQCPIYQMLAKEASENEFN